MDVGSSTGTLEIIYSYPVSLAITPVMEHNALPFLVSIPFGMETIVFCELYDYFVSIIAFGPAPAALSQSAHNTPISKY